MGGSRAAVVVAVAALLVTSAAVPAWADEPPVDGVSPVVTSTGLVEGQLVGRQQQLRPAWSDDVGVIKVQVLVNGVVYGQQQPPSETGLIWLVVSPSDDGEDIDVTIRVYDAAGNSGSATTRVHADVAAPKLTYSPPLNSYVTGVLRVDVGSVPDDLAKVVLYDDVSGQQLAEVTSAPWTLAWDTTGLSDQKRQVYFAAYDRLGNVRYSEGFYAVDNDAPTIDRVGFPYVQWQVGAFSLLAAYTHDGLGVERIEWWVDGALKATGQDFAWDVRGRTGTAQLEVRVYDHVGHRRSLTHDVLIDGIGPTITSITPANGAIVRGSTMRSTLRASDPAGLGTATFNGSGPVYGPPFTVDVRLGADGPRTVLWGVTDRLGNESSARTVVIVDNTKPSLKVTMAPKDGAKVRGTVKTSHDL